jgi:hypothetical protein
MSSPKRIPLSQSCPNIVFEIPCKSLLVGALDLKRSEIDLKSRSGYCSSTGRKGMVYELGPQATAVTQFANPADCGVRSIFGEKSNSPKTVELTWDAAETETSVRLKCIGYRPSIGIRIRSGYFPRNFKKSRHNGHFVSAHVCERHFHYGKRGLAFAEDNSGQP